MIALDNIGEVEAVNLELLLSQSQWILHTVLILRALGLGLPSFRALPDFNL